MKKFIPMLASSVALGSYQASASQVIIDNFSDAGDPSGTTFLSISGPSPAAPSSVSSSFSGLSGVIGGQRDLLLTRTDFSGSGTRRVEARISDTDPAIFEYGSTSQAAGESKLTYPGLPSLNFSSGSLFSVAFAGYDFPSSNPLVVTFELTSDSGVGSLTQNYSQSGPGTLDFLFADFTGSGDITDIDSISVNFDAPLGADFEVNSITSNADASAIPEPSGGLLIASLLGLGACLRRRN